MGVVEWKKKEWKQTCQNSCQIYVSEDKVENKQSIKVAEKV
jgi:hypothetical protein